MVTRHALIISLEGELDITFQERLSDALAPAQEHPFVVLDFTKVRYIDSTVLTMMLRMRKRRRELGFPPARIVGLDARLRRLFQITGLADVWPIYESVEEACASR